MTKQNKHKELVQLHFVRDDEGKCCPQCGTQCTIWMKKVLTLVYCQRCYPNFKDESSE